MVFDTKTVTRTVQIVAMLTPYANGLNVWHLHERFKCLRIRFKCLHKHYSRMLGVYRGLGRTVCVRVFRRNKSPRPRACLDSNRHVSIPIGAPIAKTNQNWCTLWQTKTSKSWMTLKWFPPGMASTNFTWQITIQRTSNPIFITSCHAQQLKDLPRDQPTKKLNWTLVSCVSRVGLITKTLVAS